MTQKPDFVYMSFGAGVQSSTLAALVVAGVLPPPDLAVFADTGDEPQEVYDQVEYMRGRLAAVNVELKVVSAGSIIEDIQTGNPWGFADIPAYTKLQTPVKGFGISAHETRTAQLKRQCTQHYKIVPIELAVRKELLKRGLASTDSIDRIRVNRGVIAECWLGISTDEAERMRPSRKNWIKNRWPLIERRMSRQDCKDWLAANGWAEPPKSSCRICPYHDDRYWHNMRANNPGDWDHVTKLDRDLRNGQTVIDVEDKGSLYLHRSCIPLADIDFPDQVNQLSLLGDEYMGECDEGYCFI